MTIQTTFPPQSWGQGASSPSPRASGVPAARSRAGPWTEAGRLLHPLSTAPALPEVRQARGVRASPHQPQGKAPQTRLRDETLFTDERAGGPGLPPGSLAGMSHWLYRGGRGPAKDVSRVSRVRGTPGVPTAQPGQQAPARLCLLAFSCGIPVSVFAMGAGRGGGL